MRIKWILRKLKYLLLNPGYFYFYFYGKPEKVISGVTGEPESAFFAFKKALDSDPVFFRELRDKTRSVIHRDFSFDVDHYFLYALIRTIKPSVVLETGVFHGHYTACILKGLHDNHTYSSVEGKLISIDLPAYESISESTSETRKTRLPEGYEPGWVIPGYLTDRWQLHLGDSRELLPGIVKQEQHITLFFHDSLHTYEHMMFEFESVFPFLEQGGYLMSHDVHWNRSFRHFVTQHKQKEFAVHGFGIFKKR